MNNGISENYSMKSTKLENSEKLKNETGMNWSIPKQRRSSSIKLKDRMFCALDGEGITPGPFQAQNYILFGYSLGNQHHSIQAEEGSYLSTKQIFEFLLNVPADCIPVMFSFNYDVTMWSVDMTLANQEKLKNGDWASCGKYSIKWLPSKMVEIKDGYRFIRVFDVFSFFGCAFIKAIEQYLPGDPDLAEVVEGKAMRGDFQWNELEGIVKPYMFKELVLLNRMMTQLRKLLSDVGVQPSSWHGPGAIANSLLRTNSVKEYREEPDQFIQVASQYAYFGGRFEQFKTGLFNGKVHQYDICSAYPYALTKVPSFTGNYELVVEPNQDYIPSDFSLCHITYFNPDIANTGVNPLPFRTYDHALLYPNAVDNWVWGIEYKAAKRYMPDYITLHRVAELEDNGERPFAFIQEMYDTRAKWKAEGNPAQLAAKLGMNSIYGKLAQRVGWNEEELTAPKHHQLSWAGFITATCRSMILDAIAQAPDKIIAVETDGIFSEVPLDLPIGKKLGDWEHDEYSGIMYVQNGIYFTPAPDGTWAKAKVKTRGFSPSIKTGPEVALEAVKNLDQLVSSNNRFHSIRGYLGKDTIRHWQDHEIRVKWGGTGKRIHHAIDCRACLDEVGVWHNTSWLPPYDYISTKPEDMITRSEKHPLAWLLAQEHKDMPSFYIEEDLYYRDVLEF